MKVFNKSVTAFSLIELSIVILVVGILVIGITKSSRIINQSKLKSARSLSASSPVNSIPGLSLWLDSASVNGFVSTVGDLDAVGTWYDVNTQSTSKSNATRASGSSQPKYDAKGINGLPALSFDGNDFMSLADGTIGDQRNWSTFIVAKPTVAQYISVIMGSTLAWRYYIGYDTTSSNGFSLRIYNGSAVNTSFTGYSPTVISLISRAGVFNLEATNSSGTGTASYTSNASGSVTSLTIGSYGIPTSNFFTGYIGEIIMYNRPLSNSEKNSVISYLRQKWAI
jgi:hypothetical protein